MNSEHASGPAALLLVDLQNDFVEGGALAVRGGRDVISIANELMPQFDVVVASQDWHPPDHGSFASQHPGLQPGDSFRLNGLQQTAWPDHCIQNTFGADLVSALNISGIRAVFRKGQDKTVDSYSAFFDNDRKNSTGLSDWLRSQGIRDLAVMGIATDYCVRFSAMDAIKEGFRVSLITRGCRGVELNAGDVTAAIEEMKRSGVKILT